jgi:hypothetical protein
MHNRIMSIDAWWPSLSPLTQRWLIEHNGEEVPSEIADEIQSVGGAVSDGVLTDEESDWIEEVANGEHDDEDDEDEGD